MYARHIEQLIPPSSPAPLLAQFPPPPLIHFLAPHRSSSIPHPTEPPPCPSTSWASLLFPTVSCTQLAPPSHADHEQTCVHTHTRARAHTQLHCLRYMLTWLATLYLHAVFIYTAYCILGLYIGYKLSSHPH